MSQFNVIILVALLLAVVIIRLDIISTNSFIRHTRKLSAVANEAESAKNILVESIATLKKDNDIEAFLVGLQKINLGEKLKLLTSQVSNTIIDAIQEKRTEAKKYPEDYIDNPHNVPLYEMVDLVMVFEDKNADIELLFKAWKTTLLSYHVIIITNEDTLRFVNVPSWLTDYELFTSTEILKTLQNHFHRANDINTELFKHIGLRAFGAWISDKELVYIIDNNCLPNHPMTYNNNNDTTSMSAIENDVIRQHIGNMKTPSIPNYFNNLLDPYLPKANFGKGFPLKYRNGVLTAMSHGSYIGTQELDSLSHLVDHHNPHHYLKIPATSHSNLRGGGVHHNSNSNNNNNNQHHNGGGAATTTSSPPNEQHRRNDIPYYDENEIVKMVQTIPYHHLFSMSTQNSMFMRDIIGPIYLFFNAEVLLNNGDSGNKVETIMSEEDLQAFHHYQEIICGWIIKIITDHTHVGIKYGMPSVYRLNSIAEDVIEHHFKQDVLSNFTFLANGDIFDFFQSYKLNMSSASYSTNSECGGRALRVECVFTELATEMETVLGPKYPYFRKYAEMMRLWTKVWQSRNAFLGQIYPIATKSRWQPKSPSSQCAVLTIAHNEKDLLPVWLRYHLHHFKPEDIYILDHLTEDGSLDHLPAGIHLSKLEGNKYVMPVAFRSQVVKIYQDRLLRGGYKCVLFADTDELLTPNPLAYPNGLKEYIARFINDSSRNYVRVTAYELGHMSYGNGSVVTQEPPMNWSDSILKQRHFYSPDRYYNKPLLTKVPLTYRPGFHRLYDWKLDRTIPTDPELVMFHLRSVDNDFCQHREIVKFNMTRKMDPAELARSYASHWNTYERDKKTGELCKFAIACFLGEFNKNTKIWDNTGVFPMHRLESYWSTVDM